MEDSNLSTSSPQFIVDCLEGSGGNISQKDFKSEISDLRFEAYGLMVMLHRLLCVRQTCFFYTKPAVR